MTLIVFFAFGMMLMLLAPLLRRRHGAPYALAGGAFILLGLAVLGMTHADARMGQAAIESDRRFYRIVLGFELPVLILALISLRYFKYPFWLGWAVNLVFTLGLAIVIVWLEFFWHW
jgi:cytochrome c biogenesis protein CcdA